MDKHNTVDEQIVSMRLKGLIQSDIAEHLNITRDKVRQVLKSKGITKSKYERECRHCDKSFTTVNVSKVSCSEKCRRDYNKENRGIKQTCVRCAGEFGGYKILDHCSQKCRREDRVETDARKELTLRLAKAIDPRRHKECKSCGDNFYATNANRKYCSNLCSHRSNYTNKYEPAAYNHKCKECGKHYTDNQSNSAGCSRKCKNKYENRVRYNARRDMLVGNGRVDWSISVERLVHRDKGNCHLCNNKVDMKDFEHNEQDYYIAGNYYGSVDHVIPLSKGGTHTWGNVKLAHRLCNSYKSDSVDKIKKQLALF